MPVHRYYLNPTELKFYLTPQQFEILTIMRLGNTQSEVANILSLSPRSIETQIKRAKKKLQCRTVFELGFRISHLFNIKDV